MFEVLKSPYPYINPNISSWGLSRLADGKDDFVDELIIRSLDKARIDFPTTKALFDELASTLYQERIRVTTSRWKSDKDDEKDFWNNIKGQIIKFQKEKSWEESDRKTLESILKKILYRYAYEMAANFNPSVFKFAQRFLPRIVFTFLHSIKRLFSSSSDFYKKFKITGDFDHIRNLAQEGTLVVVPTHFSNTDSPIVGWALNSIGLEALTYGAGINLFGTQPLSFFMDSLGSYKLDRRRKNKLYLDLLKTYSQMAIEADTPSLFFPGGTRSRSGAIETKLKLGLLSTAVEAQQENFIHARKKIFVLPLIINYQYNVECSTLVSQHLKEIGKEKYVPDNFEYSTSYKIIRFLKQLWTVDTDIVMSFGKPLDVIGNNVNFEGESIAPNGSTFDIKGYFEFENQIVKDEQRNFEYTKILGNKIIQSYFQFNTIMTAPLVAFVYFELVAKRHKHLNLYEILLIPREDRFIRKERYLESLATVLEQIKSLNTKGKVQVAEFILEKSPEEILINGENAISLFNSKKVIYSDTDGNMNSEDVRLAYFYHNRLKGYNLETYI